MRIAFDAFPLGSRTPNGNATYTIELIKALSALNIIDSLLIVTYWNRKKRIARLFKGCPHLAIYNWFPQPKLLGDRLSPLVTAATPLVERLLCSRCDLFHSTNPTSFPFHLPRVATTILDLIGLRDEPWAQPSSKDFFKRHTEEIVHRSSHIFAISDYTRGDIINRFPFAEAKITVTPLAANPQYTVVPKDRDFLSRYGIADTEQPYLLTVGDIQPRKNVAGILAAFTSLPNRYRNFRLLIVGQARNRNSSCGILAAIDTSAVRDRITVLHSVTDDDLVLFYNNAEALLYFSFFEGFGLPIIEAMQCGCPVVSSNTSSMKEIAEGAAIMVDPYDPESMRHGIMQVLDSPVRREQLRAMGLERAARYTWSRTAALTYEGYVKVLGSGNASR